MGFRTGFDADQLEPDSDIQALAVDQVVSVTPVDLDMTARVDFGELTAWFGEGR